MILEFSVKNFRSIKDLQTISFAATGLKSKDEELDKNNIVEIDGQRILKTVGIYGANASGKSNILKALRLFRMAVGTSLNPQTRLLPLCDHYLLNKNCEDESSFFQVVLLLDSKKYRYGFTVKKGNVIDEWLYGPANDNQTHYFLRNGTKEDIKSNETYFEESKGASKLEHDHVLYLSHVASFRKGIANKIWSYIVNNMGTNLANDSQKTFRNSSINKVEKDRATVLKMLSSFNLNYENIVISVNVVNNTEILLFKKSQHRDNELVRLNLHTHESQGTQKLFDLVGVLLDYFTKGGLLFLDELDGNFHPSLVIKLIQLFNDPAVNTANAQLLFTSHDTNLLDPKLMRRDQFYFTEKTEEDATRLYSLADLKGIRNDADFARQYLAGYYGALPKLEDYKAEAKDE